MKQLKEDWQQGALGDVNVFVCCSHKDKDYWRELQYFFEDLSHGGLPLRILAGPTDTGRIPQGGRDQRGSETD